MKTATISKWGNSLGIRLPEIFASALGLSAGDMVDLSLRDNSLIIQKINRNMTCKEYLEDFYKKPIDEIAAMQLRDEELVDWGGAVGEEISL